MACHLHCPCSCLKPLTLSILIGLLPGAAAAAAKVEFNSHLFAGQMAGQMDLSRFENGNMLPGFYSVDVRVNQTRVARREIEVRTLPDGDSAVCLTPEVTAVLGIDPARVIAHRQRESKGKKALTVLPTATICGDLSTYVPGASSQLDTGEQILEVTVPQAFIARAGEGSPHPSTWDEGVNAMRLNYNVSHQAFDHSGRKYHSTSALLDMGVNLGHWRLRHQGYYAQSSLSAGRYRAGDAYMQRNLPSLGAQIRLGQGSTRGDLFDSMPFRGISLEPDPRMLPDSQRSYAPVVRGVAQSNARVIIRQRDQVIFETTVAPGPFVIDDLYSRIYSGDLRVEVCEATGESQQFVVPYATAPQLLRQGQRRYSLTIGELQDPSLADQSTLVEATLRQGITSQTTLFAGLIGSQGYSAVLLGGALNTSLGAFSGDVSFAHTRLPSPLPKFGQQMQGASFRLNYSKRLDRTNTTLAWAAYRYSTQGYLALSDAVRLRQDTQQTHQLARQRSRFDVSVSQHLGARAGWLNLSASSANFWNRSSRSTTYALSYGGSIGSLSYNLSAQRALQYSLQSGPARQRNSLHLSLRMPLGTTPAAPRASLALSHRDGELDQARLALGGAFGALRQGNYNAAIGRTQRGGTAFDVSTQYRLPTVNTSASFSQASDSRQLALAATGGIVLHRGGVGFAQQLGETVGVIWVPGAHGASITGIHAAKTNRRGYAVLPYLIPYRLNEVTVDPKGLPLEVELKTASANAIPTAGAVVKMIVPTVTGRNALIEAFRPDGTPLPFGDDVYDPQGQAVGVVGQNSRLWVRGISEQGTLYVGQGLQRCAIAFDLATTPDILVKAQCLPHPP